MTPEVFLEKFGHYADAPDGVAKLRELVLQLAVQGKLVPQDPNDESSASLLDNIRANKPASVLKRRSPKKSDKDELKGNDAAKFAIPHTWLWVKAEDLLDVVRGVTYKKHEASSENLDGHILLLRANNIGNGLNFEKPVFVPRRIVREEQVVKAGDIIVAMSSGSKSLVGKSAQAVEDLGVTFGAFCGLIRLSNEIYKPYLGMYFCSPEYRRHISMASQGIGINNLRKSDIEMMNIPLPPLAEQKRIVAKVDALMGLCDALEAKQAARKTVRVNLNRSCLHHLTEAQSPDELRHHWHRIAQNTHHLYDTPETVKHLRQTILQLAVQGKLVPQDPNPISHPELPAGWELVPLGNLGKWSGGSTPSKRNPKFWDGDIPWVSPKDMKVDYIADSQDHVTAKALSDTSLKTYPPGALLCVIRGMILAHSFPVAVTTVQVSVNQDMKVMVPDEPKVMPYLLLALKGMKSDVLDLVKRSSHGTCRLPFEDLQDLGIPLPPLAEQKRIVEKVDALMALCDALEEKLTQADTHANRLLQSTLHTLTTDEA